MSNRKRLTDGGGEGGGGNRKLTADDIYRLCAEKNEFNDKHGILDCWYYVRVHEGHTKMESLDGPLAVDVRRVRDGTLPDFYEWPADKMAAERRKLAWFLKQGTSRMAPGPTYRPA